MFQTTKQTINGPCLITSGHTQEKTNQDVLHSGNLRWLGKMNEHHQVNRTIIKLNGHLSVAMLDYWRAIHVKTRT